MQKSRNNLAARDFLWVAFGPPQSKKETPMKYSTAAAAALFALSSSVALAQSTAPPSTSAGAPDGGAAASSDGTSKHTAPANKTDGSNSSNSSGGSSSGASTGTSGTDPSLAKDKTPPVNGKAAEPNSQTDMKK
jgi:hypothetical protein